MIVLKASTQVRQKGLEDCFRTQKGEILRVPVFTFTKRTDSRSRQYNALIGVMSGTGTSVFEVAEEDIGLADLKTSILNSYLESGWDVDIAQMKAEETLWLYETIASKYPVGEILFGIRKPPVSDLNFERFSTTKLRNHGQ